MAQTKNGFTYLVAGHIVSTLGSSIYLVALVLYLAELTDSPRVLGLVQFGAYLPAALLGPLAGALVDRWNRKHVLIWSDLLRGAAMVTVALVGVLTGRIPISVLFVLTATIGICGVFFVPAVFALIPDVVAAGAVKRSNGVRSASTQVANLVGSALGGVLFAVLGAPLLFLANGVSFLISAFSEVAIQPAPRSRDAPERILEAVRDGFRYLIGNRSIRGLVVVQGAVNLLVPPLVVGLPFVISDVWALDESYFGYFFAAVLGGGIVAFTLLSRASIARRSEGVAYWASPIALVISLAAIGGFVRLGGPLMSSTAIVVLFILFSLSGAAVGTLYLIGTTRLQQMVPAGMRGRVFAASETAVAALLPVTYALSGVVVQAVRGSLWLVFAAVAFLAALLALLVATNRELQQVVGE